MNHSIFLCYCPHLKLIRDCSNLETMTQPLALVYYEKLLPGSQLVNRLQDLSYRVQTVSEAAKLVECAEQVMPMLVLADLESAGKDICPAIARLKQNPATRHIPVIAFSSEPATELQEAARVAGATLVVTDTAIVNHLPQFLDQALQVE
jgi:CheY-like chemotaxis protein